MSASWLLLVPAAAVLAIDVLVVALCRAARRGDDMAREALDRRNRGR